MAPQQRQAEFGNQWYIVRTTAGGSNTIPTRQHPELGQAHRARVDDNATQQVTGGQAGSQTSQAPEPRLQGMKKVETHNPEHLFTDMCRTQRKTAVLHMTLLETRVSLCFAGYPWHFPVPLVSILWRLLVFRVVSSTGWAHSSHAEGHSSHSESLSVKVK